MHFVNYPDITVQMSGGDRNAFSILERVVLALRHAGVSDHEIRLFTDEAMNGDYDNLLRVVMRTVVVE